MFIVNSNSRNFREFGFPEVLPKKNIEKIHFLIFPKQNTFTKPRKLKNCVNTANTKTKPIIILDFSQTNTKKSNLDCVCCKNKKIKEKRK